MNWSNWATIADLATALGTLILAVATFSAVRSANLTARIAQESLLVGLRPVLMASHRDDPVQKVNFGDRKWVRIPGGGAVGEVGGGGRLDGVGSRDLPRHGAPQRGQRHRGAARVAFLPGVVSRGQPRAA